MHKRLLIILTTITLSTALLVGCGNKQEEIPQATTEEIAPEQTEEETTPPTEIAEPTPEATTEPVEEATTEPETTETTETAESEQAEIPTPEPEPQAIYTYTDMSATMYAQQTVNVRDLPDTSGNKLGSLSTNDEIKIFGQCNETGWYMFEYNGSVAYVSNKYIGENKVEIQAPANNSGSGGGSTAGTGSTSGAFNEADFPTPYQIINKGGLNVYFVMGTDADKNYDTKMQCIDTVGSNLGIAMTYDGIGTYYFFGDYYHGGSNANGVVALFFPYYYDANGNELGQSPETQKKVY
ncbi:MAG: SH3 domain-containing protein [Lachnospiraceae bacterium]|nr:SH3 domain-containing protein [Lachnospiraceae bacterium]